MTKQKKLRHLEYYDLQETFDKKSKVVNLKKKSSEFLGFELKAVRKGKKYAVQSHMLKKSKKRVAEKLKQKIVEIEHSKNAKELGIQVRHYNTIVFGIHNYYRIATHIYHVIAVRFMLKSVRLSTIG